VSSTALVLVLYPIDPSIAGLALIYSLSMSTMFQWLIRQAIETENQFTSVERLIHYKHNLPMEAAVHIPGAFLFSRLCFNSPVGFFLAVLHLMRKISLSRCSRQCASKGLAFARSYRFSRCDSFVQFPTFTSSPKSLLQIKTFRENWDCRTHRRCTISLHRLTVRLSNSSFLR
jgi:DNA-binding transcriptional MocR family regulator